MAAAARRVLLKSFLLAAGSGLGSKKQCRTALTSTSSKLHFPKSLISAIFPEGR